MSESNEVPFVDKCYVGTQSEANVDEKSVQDDKLDDHADRKEPDIIMDVALSPVDIGQRCLLGVSEKNVEQTTHGVVIESVTIAQDTRADDMGTFILTLIIVSLTWMDGLVTAS